MTYLSVMNMLIYHKMRQNRAKHRLRSPTTKKAGNLATILLAIGRSNYTSFISRILVS